MSFETKHRCRFKLDEMAPFLLILSPDAKHRGSCRLASCTLQLPGIQIHGELA